MLPKHTLFPMNITDLISKLVASAIWKSEIANVIPDSLISQLTVERPQKPEHGDFASSLPLKLAGPLRTNPVEIAKRLAEHVPPNAAVERVWGAPPGFLNFSLSTNWLAEQIDVIREAGTSYGNVDIGAGRRVQVEFVSINPTGPLHVGHARGAAFGSGLANILEAAGYEVQREYFVNDAGTQMELFNKTLYARYKQQLGIDVPIPEDGYQGAYMVDLAKEILESSSDRFLSMDEEQALEELGELGLERMLYQIRTDLEDLRVTYDVWFSERTLYSNGQYDSAMEILKEKGLLVERDNATWFASSTLGDDDDKVLVRSTGDPSYFASDVAYHYDKLLRRKFDRVINVWGADHQGHRRFFPALAVALGVPQQCLKLVIYQLVTLRRGEEIVRLSKRAGDIITLRELVDEVGADACRYFFLARSPQSQMDFDLELAKEQSPENPVYYVQYGHARIAGILRLAKERGIEYSDGDLSLISHEAELALIRKMLVLPELMEKMASTLEPHHLPHYALELASTFHTFYDNCRVVSSEPGEEQITKARLKLTEAASVVLARCLELMSMSAPEEM